jgi:hypothetical protein
MAAQKQEKNKTSNSEAVVYQEGKCSDIASVFEALTSGAHNNYAGRP